MAQTVQGLPTVWETQVQSLGWEDLLEKKWQPTPVFLPGKSHGRRNLEGYNLWGRKQSDTPEQLHFLLFEFSQYDCLKRLSNCVSKALLLGIRSTRNKYCYCLLHTFLCQYPNNHLFQKVEKKYDLRGKVPDSLNPAWTVLSRKLCTHDNGFSSLRRKQVQPEMDT